MKLLVLILLVAVAVCSAGKSKHTEKSKPKVWALLVAGSKGFINYRHQADVAHAYKLLRRRGIPAKHIVVLSYDDVPHDPKNPLKGHLINRPGGPNLYKGLKIDYKKNSVTPEVFLAVLSGNKKAVKGKGTGRVIESGPHDLVFVNFVDHGGPGILGFPNGDLDAKTFIDTLKHLTKHKRYNKLLLYIEACNAGSTFDKLLPENTHILVSTASAGDESSFATYCGYKSYPCLADLYSVSWMEHVDKKIKENENIFDQYQAVRRKTNLSHVQLYGDFKVGSSLTKKFIGVRNKAAPKSFKNNQENDVVPSRDVALHYYLRMAENAVNQVEKEKYIQMVDELVEKREFVDETVKEIVNRFAQNDIETINEIENTQNTLTENMLDDYSRVYHYFSDKCFNLSNNQYILKHFHKFVNICRKGNSHANRLIEAIDSVCDGDFPVVTGTD